MKRIILLLIESAAMLYSTAQHIGIDTTAPDDNVAVIGNL